MTGTNKTVFLASNTSTIPITEIAAATSRPQRFVGIHFFNPPVLMPLVEVIRGELTDQETVDAAVPFSKALGKQVVLCRKDVPGFIVNRILGPLLNEAAWTVGRGQATVEQVDSAAVYKTGLPMGLFELADYTGIDVIYKAAEAVKSREPAALAPAPLFSEKYRQGKLGKKTGEGFYSYGKASGRPQITKEPGESVDPLVVLLRGGQRGGVAGQEPGLFRGRTWTSRSSSDWASRTGFSGWRTGGG